MRIAIAPASPKTAAAAIRTLLHGNETSGDPVEIRAFYRDTSRAPVGFTSSAHFQALRAELDDPDALDFTGVDAVLAITPPSVAASSGSAVEFAESVSRGVREAVERAGCVKKLVLLSSIGAHLSEGVGEIKTNNVAEAILSQTTVPSITFIRCAYFMENWASAVETLAAPEPFFRSTITPLDWEVAMVAVRDVGAVLARELVSGMKTSGPEPYVYELHGPRPYAPSDVQEALAEVTGRSVAVQPVDKDKLLDFFGKVFAPSVAAEMEEMTVAFLPGGKMIVDADPVAREIVRGKTELVDALRDLVKGSV